MNQCGFLVLFIVALWGSRPDLLSAENTPQKVDGFDRVLFHYDDIRAAPQKDFLGMSRGYFTAGWWTVHTASNVVVWQTAAVPKKERTTLVFVGASSVVPTRFVRGPEAALYVNGSNVLSFGIGWTKDVTWKAGDYQLRYISKRVEYPFFGTQRQFYNEGNSGIYELTVPAEAVEENKPVELKVHLLPFSGWSNGWFAVKEWRNVVTRSPESFSGEIEALRADMNQMGLQLQVLAGRVYPELRGGARFQHKVLHSNGFRHLHPADLIRLSDGELLLMAREATEHISRDGDVIMLRSRDGGKTWGEKQVIAAMENIDEREGCGLQLKDGSVLVGIYYNNLYNGEGKYKVDLSKPSGRTNLHNLGAYTIRSKDRGKTWSEPAWIETDGMPFRNLEGPTDAPIQLSDGTVLMALIGYAINGDSKNTASVMVQSKDGGESWQYLSTIASDPGGKLGGFMEPGIVQTRTGRIVAGLRNHALEAAIWMTYSDDLGKTWAPVKKTAMIGHPVDLIQLADGRLMATYGVRQGQHTTPGGIRACFSSDNGETWPLEGEVELRGDFMNWDIGYPESMQMPDGRVLTVYYYNLFGKFFLGGTYWAP